MSYSPATAPLEDLVTFEDWQANLEGLFARLLDLDAPAVSFLRQPRQHHRGPRAQLDPISFRHVGVEDVRRTVDAGDLTEELIGHRVMVLQVRVWSERQSLQHAPSARIEALRTRMRWTSTTQALKRCALGFERAEQPVDFPGTRDGRVLSSASIDLLLAYAWVEADTEHALGWIDRAEIRANFLRDPAGTPYPAVLQPTINVDASTP